MNQRTVIVVTDPPKRRVFSTLRDACNHYGWVYNTLSRKGSKFFINDSILVERIEIIRKGG
jgi:hypothetical protein